MRIPTHSSGPWSRNSFGKPNSFSTARLSRSLPTSLASPFYGVLSTEPCARVYNPFSFVSALFEGHGNTEDPRTKGIEAWASIWLCLGTQANNGDSMSLCRRRSNATAELSPCLWWPCKYLFTSSRWGQIILLNGALCLKSRGFKYEFYLMFK